MMSILHKLLRKDVNILKNYKYTLQGLDCANCAKKIEDKIARTKGYQEVIVNFSTLRLSFQTDKKQGVEEEITQMVHSLEPDVIVIPQGKEKKEQKAERNTFDILRLVIGVTLYFLGSYALKGTGETILTIMALILLLSKITKKAFIQMVKNKTLDENALISISAIGACFVGKSMEGIMVIVLYEIGKILEARAVAKTRKSITDLMDIKPQYANLKTKEGIKQVKPEEVQIGDVLILKTGEKIPLDGIVLSGEGEIDHSALTGESNLITIQTGGKVLSGAIVVQGLMEVKVEKNYENSTVNQILNLVENATDKKAQTETFVAKAAKIYTPIVLGLAILVAIFMPLIFAKVTYSESIYKALIFLVISCPCSIAISIPLSYFTGIGKASKRGILVKGSDYLDRLKDIKQILFDKTGTITTGNFKVSQINPLDKNYTQEEILNYFILGESFSNHPIAKSILKEAKKEVNVKEIENYKEVAGKGIQYQYQEKEIKIGNLEFMEEKESEREEKETKEDKKDKKHKKAQKTQEGTILYLKIEDKIIGNIVLTDEIKPKAKETIRKLHKMGIQTKMLTGDKKEVAIRIAKEVGIQEVKYELLPQDKYEELEKVLEEKNKEKTIIRQQEKQKRKVQQEKVAYVGDGINDSPVLARADIGISMGGIGSSSAIEASDVVIMTDQLEKIIEGIAISQKTNRIIKQNLIFSIGVKLAILSLSLFGIADMWEAVFADVGTTLITIVNTIRILK